MNRRKAIGHILLAGAGGGIIAAGYKWHDWHKAPDMAFVEANKSLIAALAETIIPATDTPGAIEAGVPDFIIVMLKDCTETKSKNKFINGLKELQAYSLSNYDKPYENCTAEQQYSILKHFEERDKPWSGIMGKIQNRFLGRPFFATLKHYTVEGYGTSMIGSTKGFIWLPVPGRYLGCIPMQPGQRSWATK